VTGEVFGQHPVLPAESFELLMRQVPYEAVLLGLRRIVLLHAVEEYPVAEQLAFGTLVQKLAILVQQAHGAFADDGQAG
jgi:hypothetical protein